MPRLPKPDSDAGGSGGPQFLKAKDIGKVGTSARLAIRGNVRVEDSQFGEQCIMDVLFRGGVVTFAVKTASPNYRMLYDRFGSNVSKWKGPIDVQVKHFASNDYIAILDKSKSGNARKASARPIAKKAKRRARAAGSK